MYFCIMTKIKIIPTVKISYGEDTFTRRPVLKRRAVLYNYNSIRAPYSYHKHKANNLQFQRFNCRGCNTPTSRHLEEFWDSSWEDSESNEKGLPRQRRYSRIINVQCSTKPLTPWRIGLLKELWFLQLVKKSPSNCGNRKFIAAFKKAHHLQK